MPIVQLVLTEMWATMCLPAQPQGPATLADVVAASVGGGLVVEQESITMSLISIMHAAQPSGMDGSFDSAL